MARIAKRPLAAIRKITGLNDLRYDRDGDICPLYSRIPIFIRLIGDPLLIRLYAPLVQDVRKTARLYGWLNELNSSIVFMHFFVRDKTIYAISEIAATPLQYTILESTMRLFTTIAERTNEKLKAEFTGKATKLNHPRSSMVH